MAVVRRDHYREVKLHIGLLKNNLLLQRVAVVENVESWPLIEFHSVFFNIHFFNPVSITVSSIKCLRMFFKFLLLLFVSV